MTGMTGPDCGVVYNIINTSAHTRPNTGPDVPPSPRREYLYLLQLGVDVNPLGSALVDREMESALRQVHDARLPYLLDCPDETCRYRFFLTS